MSSFLKKATPHFIAIGVFLLIAIIYCQPSLQGKVVNQHDVLGWKGMAQQSFEYKEKNGHFPLWTNSLFSGMPGYNVAIDAKLPVLVGYVYSIVTLFLPIPAQYFFLACLAFYFLCMVMGMRSVVGVLAALAFAYASYDAVIISVGHNTKMQALALAPAVIASLLLLFQKRYLWGMGLMAVFFGVQFGTQHLQVVYYTLIIMGFLTLAFVISSYREKQLKPAFTGIALAAVAGLIGFLTYSVSLMPIQEYAKYTMRGGRTDRIASTDTKNATKGGLDKDYAFEYSYGLSETFTLLIPGAYGGSNGGREHKAPTAYTEKLAEVGVPEESGQQMINGMSYWGDQRILSGTVYLGAIVCFLFIFGLVYIKGWHKWWIAAAALFGIMLAWGRHFSTLNYLLFDILPFYNKFRAPTIALVIPQLMLPLLGAFALDKLLAAKESRDELFKKLKLATFITAGIFVLAALFYFSADFKGPNDNARISNLTDNMLMQQGPQPSQEMQQRVAAFGRELRNALEEDRRSLFRSDALRSLLFIAVAIVLIGAFIKNKIKALPTAIALTLLVGIDAIGIDRRYLNHDDYVESEDFESAFVPTNADKQIMADPNKPFRVFDQTDPNGPFSSSRASYFHNSIGGYHPAKLGIYQDLIERQIGNGNMQVLNMLNTKYVIVNDPSGRQPVAQINPYAYGPVWLVKQVHFVKSPDEEMNALDSISVRDTAIVQEKFRNAIRFMPQYDSSATIAVNEYLNDKVTYKFSAATNQFAVFSEIYYPAGWNAYIDGNKADIVRTDYVLRGMAVPAGQHTIEFRFEPASYQLGNTLGFAANLAALGLLAAAIVMEVRRKRPAGQPSSK